MRQQQVFLVFVVVRNVVLSTFFRNQTLFRVVILLQWLLGTVIEELDSAVVNLLARLLLLVLHLLFLQVLGRHIVGVELDVEIGKGSSLHIIESILLDLLDTLVEAAIQLVESQKAVTALNHDQLAVKAPFIARRTSPLENTGPLRFEANWHERARAQLVLARCLLFQSEWQGRRLW